jgi:enterochelin esterase family protein
MAGASQQGATSFDVAMTNLDKIANLGVFGTGLYGGLINSPTFAPYPPFDFDKEMPVVAAKMKANKLKLWYMAVGTIDPREPFNEKAVAQFDKYGIKPIFKTFSGGHQDKVWRAATIDFLQLVFR